MIHVHEVANDISKASVFVILLYKLINTWLKERTPVKFLLNFVFLNGTFVWIQSVCDNK